MTWPNCESCPIYKTFVSGDIDKHISFMYLCMTMNAIIISLLLFVSLSTIDVNYQSIEIRIDMVTYDDRMYVYGYYS